MSLPEPARLRCDDVRLDFENKRQHRGSARYPRQRLGANKASEQTAKATKHQERNSKVETAIAAGIMRVKCEAKSNTMAEGGGRVHLPKRL